MNSQSLFTTTIISIGVAAVVGSQAIPTQTNSLATRQSSKPKEEKMFLGLRTAVYHVTDLAKAKAWYSEVLGFEPYFDEPFYVGFNVAGYELGLLPDSTDNRNKATGVVAYWGVEDAEASFNRLLELGATKHTDVEDVGEGILVGSVLDPFGNVFGIIKNPQFKLEGQ